MKGILHNYKSKHWNRTKSLQMIEQIQKPKQTLYDFQKLYKQKTEPKIIRHLFSPYSGHITSIQKIRCKTCAAQRGSHQPHVAVEHLKCDKCVIFKPLLATEGTDCVLCAEVYCRYKIGQIWQYLIKQAKYVIRDFVY